MLNSALSQQLAMTTGMIPVFSGLPSEDVSEWIESFTLLCTSKGLDEASQRLYLRNLLTDNAKKFYKFVQGNSLPGKEVLERLKKNFEEEFLESLYTEMQTLEKKPGES
ncbi:hypothetical protein PAEPH01_1833 [Pancytospora epiphaga]|nr:hypothetical protein PAEPH01_1833 [Pancytospora epiphaga]